MTDFSRIYQSLLATGQPATLPAIWHGYPACDGFIELPEDGAALRGELLHQFTPEDLIAAGVLTAAGELVDAICSGDDASEKPLAIGLRRQTDEPLFGLVSNMHSLGGDSLPMSAMLQDYRVQQRLNGERNMVFVACSMQDLFALMSVGLPSVPVTSLETLGGTQLDLLCEQLGFCSQPDAEPDSHLAQGTAAATSQPVTPIELMIVDWSPARLEQFDQPALEVVSAHLIKLQGLLGIDLGEPGSWQPNDNELVAMRFAAEFGRDKLAKIVLDTLEYRCFDLDEPLAESVTDPAPPGYQEVLAEWIRCPSSETAEVETLRRRLFELQEQLFIAPLLEQAKQEPDTVRRNDYARLAALSREFYTLTNDLARQRGRMPAGVPTAPFSKDLIVLERRIAELSERLQGQTSGSSIRSNNRSRSQAPPPAAVAAAMGFGRKV